jgi:uncharacterized OB-fold protein
MTTNLSVYICNACRAACFPEPLLCSQCHKPEFNLLEVERGVVQEVSVVHRIAGQDDWKPRMIANVKLHGELQLTVGLHGQAEQNDEVMLTLEGTAPYGRPSTG